ncbi:hypothetical protein A2U01_0071198, partial [Trifolium medium]|nr:hypothetical protein [Trifolium medium]
MLNQEDTLFLYPSSPGEQGSLDIFSTPTGTRLRHINTPISAVNS